MNLLERVTASRAGAPIILIRILVGAVFLSEGIQKLLFPAMLGVARFAKIGIPYPSFSAPFVGVVETVCGALVIAGLLTRLAAIPLLAVVSTAIATTKIPMLLDQGFWHMAHEARTDFSMLLGLVFLLIEGAGRWSVDWRFAARATPRSPSAPVLVTPRPPRK